MTLKIRDIKENLTYLALWLILFLTPMISMGIRSTTDSGFEFNWTEIFHVWRIYGVYFVIFLIHNFLLAPILIYKHKKLMYFATTICLLSVFFVYQCLQRPERPMHHKFRHHHEMMDRGPQQLEKMQDMRTKDFEGAFDEEAKPMHQRGKRHRRMNPNDKPPFGFGPSDIIHSIMMVLLLGMNLGVKLYFKSDRDEKEMQLLEKKNLEQQLEYLKYQINPHFFMNTLNNIHALVDIEPEQAKTTILELSKLMRYVLYEGAKSSVLLGHEIDFLNNYITLMKLRFTDKVKIQIDIPSIVPEKLVPPMLFITFVENAFKHGISYKEESFINVKMRFDDNRIYFTCENSKHEESIAERGGVGLQNVKKRLELIYGENYHLDINDGAKEYTVQLDIPLEGVKT